MVFPVPVALSVPVFSSAPLRLKVAFGPFENVEPTTEPVIPVVEVEVKVPLLVRVMPPIIFIGPETVMFAPEAMFLFPERMLRVSVLLMVPVPAICLLLPSVL